VKVVIDTNILFQFLKNKVDLLDYKIVIPDFILKEFIYKAKEYHVRNLDTFLKKLKENFEILETNYIFNKNADDLLIKLCKEKKFALLTIDKKLKKRALKEGIKVLNLRKGKYVEEDYLNLY
jgi:rRNA-processing protein FCF1